jgi:hypothetical protein
LGAATERYGAELRGCFNMQDQGFGHSNNNVTPLGFLEHCQLKSVSNSSKKKSYVKYQLSYLI